MMSCFVVPFQCNSKNDCFLGVILLLYMRFILWCWQTKSLPLNWWLVRQKIQQQKFRCFQTLEILFRKSRSNDYVRWNKFFAITTTVNNDKAKHSNYSFLNSFIFWCPNSFHSKFCVDFLCCCDSMSFLSYSHCYGLWMSHVCSKLSYKKWFASLMVNM